MAEAAVNDMRARYDLGRVINSLRYDSSNAFTARTLANVARVLNLKPSTLRCYARVAARIRAVEFDEYVNLRGSHGTRLTWSHIEELAETRGSDVRRKLAAEAVFKALSVGALRNRVRAAPNS
jgi:hypothetical protein